MSLFGDQSSSSRIERIRNTALQQAKKAAMVPAFYGISPVKNKVYDKMSHLDALRRTRAGGAVIPNNVARPNTVSPVFPVAPVAVRNEMNARREANALCLQCPQR